MLIDSYLLGGTARGTMCLHERHFEFCQMCSAAWTAALQRAGFDNGDEGSEQDFPDMDLSFDDIMPGDIGISGDGHGHDIRD